MKTVLLVIILSISCNAKSQKNIVYKMDEVDIKPHYVGGEYEMNHFIQTHLKWPSNDFGYSGYVMVSANVKIDGTLDSVLVSKKLCSFCDDEAKRVVGLMPKWSPAIKESKPVTCKIEIPIYFKLN